VIATQNSVDFHGTYPLPEAQPVESLQACLKFSELQSLQAQVKQVRISEELKCYIVDIVAATRGAEEVCYHKKWFWQLINMSLNTDLLLRHCF
jgi:MoxR-like ATPase